MTLKIVVTNSPLRSGSHSEAPEAHRHSASGRAEEEGSVVSTGRSAPTRPASFLKRRDGFKQVYPRGRLLRESPFSFGGSIVARLAWLRWRNRATFNLSVSIEGSRMEAPDFRVRLFENFAADERLRGSAPVRRRTEPLRVG